MDKAKREKIRALVRTMYDFQEQRIRTANRLGLKKDNTRQENHQDDGIDTMSIPALVDFKNESDEMEKKLAKAIAEELQDVPIYNLFLKDVKGVGPLMAGIIVSEYDIEIATTVSKLWAFTGLAPGRDRLKKGEKACFNKWLRTKMCGVLAGSFLKSRSPYAEYYYNMKTRRENSEQMTKEWKKGGEAEVRWCDATPAHRHRDAIRYMIKMFLKDLYVMWRTIEDLPVREPYSEEYLGKKHSA